MISTLHLRIEHKLGLVRPKSPCTNSFTYVPACVHKLNLNIKGLSSSMFIFFSTLRSTFMLYTLRVRNALGLRYE